MITVFTPTYNRKAELQNLYDSLKLQEYKDFEWLVVDDGSTDGTDVFVQNLKKENLMKIEYYKQENSGKMMAYNKALELAKGEIFLRY